MGSIGLSAQLLTPATKVDLEDMEHNSRLAVVPWGPVDTLTPRMLLDDIEDITWAFWRRRRRQEGS